MKALFYFLLIAGINLNAYCLFNKTNQNLLFMVEFYPKASESIFVFKKTVKPNEVSCCKTGDSCNPLIQKNQQLSFYAFKNEKAVEGCDIFGLNDSNVTLNSFLVFDNCEWSVD